MNASADSTISSSAPARARVVWRGSWALVVLLVGLASACDGTRPASDGGAGGSSNSGGRVSTTATGGQGGGGASSGGANGSGGKTTGSGGHASGGAGGHGASTGGISGSGSGGAASGGAAGSSSGGAGGGASCASAVENATCTNEGQTCGGPCTDICQFCTLFHCSGGRWLRSEAAPAPCFSCGENAKCAAIRSYCQVLSVGPTSTAQYACKDLPAACLPKASCDCLSAQGVPGTCKDDGSGNGSLTTMVDGT